MELFLFDIFILFLVIVDMYYYKKQITPLSIIALVYVLLINLNNLAVSNIYGFYNVENYVLAALSVFFVFIFIVDMIFGYLYRHMKKVDSAHSIRFRDYRVVTALFLTGAAAYGIQFVRLYAAYGLNIKGSNNGILGHLSSLAFLLGPVSLDLAIKSGKRFRISLSAALNIVVLAISVLFGGKYVIFINLIYFILYFILKRDRKPGIGKMAKIAVPLAAAAVLVFTAIYYVIPRATGRYQSTMDFVIRHMFDYLLGPVVANNYTISHAEMGNALIPFTVFINIGKALGGSGNYVAPIYQFLFPVYGTYRTNVSGFFGEVVYNLGFVGALEYIILFFVVINVFVLLYRLENKYYLSFCYSLAVLAFMFFCNYITVSGVVLPWIYVFALDTFSMCRIGDYHI